jgi:serine/threonine-protein kinase
VISVEDQLGVLLAGHPLEIGESSRAGETRAGSPLAITLPRGSYLFVLEKPGYARVRFPMVVPFDEGGAGHEVQTVKLPLEGDVPPGYIYIPAGPVCTGGDEEVDQALPRGTHRVDGFFLSRFEVTFGEYLGFINSKGVFETTLDQSDFDKARAKPDGLIPVDRTRLLVELDDRAGAWRPRAGIDLAYAVVGISPGAARRYADWLTAKHGGRWRFRLPTDLEWEKAARGVDRRYYVWGNYMVWSFCSSLYGSHRTNESGGRRSIPEPVGLHPIDESVFGVRDMAGSVCEPTSGETIRGYVSVRGGSWYEPTEYYYRIANREGRLRARGLDQGIRLAAEIP